MFAIEFNSKPYKCLLKLESSKGTGFLDAELLELQGIEEEGSSIDAVAALPCFETKTQQGGFEVSAKTPQVVPQLRDWPDEVPRPVGKPVRPRSTMHSGETLFSMLLNSVREAREKMVRSNTTSTPVDVFKNTLKNISGIGIGEISLRPSGRPAVLPRAPRSSYWKGEAGCHRGVVFANGGGQIDLANGPESGERLRSHSIRDHIVKPMMPTIVISPSSSTRAVASDGVQDFEQVLISEVAKHRATLGFGFSANSTKRNWTEDRAWH